MIKRGTPGCIGSCHKNSSLTGGATPGNMATILKYNIASTPLARFDKVHGTIACSFDSALGQSEEAI